MVQTSDVIIIGGGIHGASLAFHLAQRGVKALVLDKQFVASGATGRSSGLVRMHYDLRLESELVWQSFQYFRNWEEMVGGDCGFVRTGFIRMVQPEYEDALRANVKIQQEIGIPTLLVTPDDIKRLAPYMVTDDFTVAAYEPESGYADPPATAMSMMTAARAMGAVLKTGVQVIDVLTDDSKVLGVKTSDGDEFHAPVVVDAAGAWADRIARMVGLELPMTTWSHDVMFIRRPREIGPSHPTVIDDINEMYFRPEQGGLTLVGLESDNPLGEDPDNDTDHAHPGYVERAVDHICRRIPAMEEGSLHSAHMGYDGISDDLRAILGPAGPEGFWLNCGHSGTGFKIGPAVGLCMAEWMVDGMPQTVDIRPFSFSRFAEGKLLRGEHPYADIWR
jgi:sarcosine oxidase subunit beta